MSFQTSTCPHTFYLAYTQAFSYSDLYIFFTYYRTITFPEKNLDDLKWHHFCVTWNNYMDVDVYMDGEKQKSKVMNPYYQYYYGHMVRGELTVLSKFNQEIHLSGLQFGYDQLSKKKIKKLSMSCIKRFSSDEVSLAWEAFDSTITSRDRKIRRKSPSQCEKPS